MTVRGALVGFIEVKAPGKGADPRRFRDPHDREQWERLKSLPNLMYTDGGSFSVWRDGELDGAIVRLQGELADAGAALAAPPALHMLFEDFLRWQPIAPRSARELAELTARLCRLLRDEVVEQMAHGSAPLTELATDWRRLLFPDASDERFADGYAQAVTFGLLVARARGLSLREGLDSVARGLGRTDSLIGTALRLLTDSAENQKVLQTSIGTLVRVLDEVEWSVLSRGDADAWLYFYEQFLDVYDSRLRKQTGSYYTPPEVVEAMVRLVDDALRTRFDRPQGLGASNVTIADPAVGTGTFLLGVLRRIAAAVEAADGAGAVPAAIDAAIKRIYAFEIQLGPYAVAQLRIVAELTALCGEVPHEPLRMFVTDTLANPWIEQERMGALYEPIAESRRRANVIKRENAITVVVGNPPYKEKARGMGGWVESGGENHPAPLLDWMPPPEWGVSAHSKHLRNLYVYFWRWATWKVFDHDPAADRGIVCFITVAAHPAYTAQFASDLVRPGLRIPLTADAVLFAEAVALGRRLIWLHSYGKRCIDPAADRPSGAPRAAAGTAPVIPREGRISSEPDDFPDLLEYDAASRRLRIGSGFVDNVDPAVWSYTVSGKHVVKRWFSYRRKSRARPLIGDRRAPSPLGDIQPDRWPHAYTTDLIDLLNVLTLVVQMEPQLADLLARVCAEPLLSAAEVEAACGPDRPVAPGRRHDPGQTSLLD